jgi:hypothetical protein
MGLPRGPFPLLQATCWALPQHWQGVELGPASSETPLPLRQMTSMKEATGDRLEGQSDWPFEEEVLKRSHLGSSSTTMPEGREGE